MAKACVTEVVQINCCSHFATSICVGVFESAVCLYVCVLFLLLLSSRPSVLSQLRVEVHAFGSGAAGVCYWCDFQLVLVPIFARTDPLALCFVA